MFKCDIETWHQNSHVVRRCHVLGLIKLKCFYSTSKSVSHDINKFSVLVLGFGTEI